MTRRRPAERRPDPSDPKGKQYTFAEFEKFYQGNAQKKWDQAAMVTRKRDPNQNTGCTFTRKEFIEFYGEEKGLELWNRDEKVETYPFDLGKYKWNVSGRNVWFDRGLMWMYAYHHEEAIRCFKKALRENPGCVMAKWCIAYSMGPNYNLPWGFLTDNVLKAARAAALEALELCKKHSKRKFESHLCEALLLRYPENTKGNTDLWDEKFAGAMVDAAHQFPKELDVLVLAAEAIMGITPWKLWDLPTGKPAPPPARTLEAIDLLEQAQQVVESTRGLRGHPGLCHFYIHCMEMSPHPEKALKYRDLLTNPPLVPDAGHLVHMGTHIDILCGYYYEAMYWNHVGGKVDEKYTKHIGTDKCFYSLYKVHNYHFKMYGAMFLGNYAMSLDAAEDIWKLARDDVLRFDKLPATMASMLETFKATKFHVYVRFGKWEEILAHPFPEDRELNCVTTATLYYARALAYALGRNDMKKAREEEQQFVEAIERVPEGLGRTLHNNTARDILAVSRQLLTGELLFREGKAEEAYAALRKAVEMDDGLPYDEPWGFMQPTRHALGALLMEKGRYAEAETVYREDLGMVKRLNRPAIHPDNVWSLHGLSECLEKQGKRDPNVDFRLDIAGARADVPINASCFCRRVCCGDAK